MTQHQIHFGQKTLSFYCELRPASAKYKMKLIIHPQKGLVVRYATNISFLEVENFLLLHQNWIEKNLLRPEQVSPVFSAEHFYIPWLGEQKRVLFNVHAKNQLYILHSDDAVNVFLPSQWFVVIMQPLHPDFEEVRLKLNHALRAWYKKQALAIFPDLLKECVVCCPWVKTIPTIRIKIQKTRWGSCSSLGNINLNAALLQFPIKTIRNVIFHELCHLKYQNHSSDFYRLLGSVDPEWKSHHVSLKKGRSVLFE